MDLSQLCGVVSATFVALAFGVWFFPAPVATPEDIQVARATATAMAVLFFGLGGSAAYRAHRIGANGGGR